MKPEWEIAGVTLEALQRLAEERRDWPVLSGYEVWHGVVCGIGRALFDERYVSEAEQEALLPPLSEALACDIDRALARRANLVYPHSTTDTPPKTT